MKNRMKKLILFVYCIFFCFSCNDVILNTYKLKQINLDKEISGSFLILFINPNGKSYFWFYIENNKKEVTFKELPCNWVKIIECNCKPYAEEILTDAFNEEWKIFIPKDSINYKFNHKN